MCTHSQATLNPLPSNKAGDACGPSSFQYSHILCVRTILNAFITDPDSFQEHSALPQHSFFSLELTLHLCAVAQSDTMGLSHPPTQAQRLLADLTLSQLCQGSTSKCSRCWLCSSVAPSSLWLYLFQGFIAIWDWFPALDCLYPITRGSDCCQMVSLCVNCLGDCCVLRGGKKNKKNLAVCLLYEPLEILHCFCSGLFLSGSKVFEVQLEALKSSQMFRSPFSASFSLPAFGLICYSSISLGPVTVWNHGWGLPLLQHFQLQ